MILIKILFEIMCFQQTLSFVISPGSPVPHAEVLDDFLDATHFKNYTETNSISVFDYLFGNNFTDLDNLQISEHLDISVLTPENIKKVVEEAQRKYLFETKSFNESVKGNIRRYYDYIYYGNLEIKMKAMNWMKQSIYGTRRRLEVTRPFRKKFHRDISYNIGILYGILKEMMVKLDSVYTAMNRIHFHSKYIWFIFVYQRLLSFHVDITFIVQRMFEFQKKWNTLIGRKEKGEYQEEGEVDGFPMNIGNNTAAIKEIVQGMDFSGNHAMHPGASAPGPYGIPGSHGGLGPHGGSGLNKGQGPQTGLGPEAGYKWRPEHQQGSGPPGGLGPQGPGIYGGPESLGGLSPQEGPGPHGGPVSQGRLGPHQVSEPYR